MSARDHVLSPATGARLAELLMSAAAELSEAPRTDLAPMGIPVRDGRLSLGRLREVLPRESRRGDRAPWRDQGGCNALADPGFVLDVLTAANGDGDAATVGRVLEFLRLRAHATPAVVAAVPAGVKLATRSSSTRRGRSL